MIIRVQTDDFDLSAINRELMAGRSDVGAIASFVGLVRDLAGDPLHTMTLEHYPGMTESALQRIADQACARWEVANLVGWLQGSDPVNNRQIGHFEPLHVSVAPATHERSRAP